MLSTKDIAELEKKHSSYVFKKISKSFLSIFSIVAIISIAFYSYFYYRNPKIISKRKIPLAKHDSTNTTIAIQKIDINTSPKKKTVKTEQTQKDTKVTFIPNNNIDEKKQDNRSKDDLKFPILSSNETSNKRPNRRKLNFVCSGAIETAQHFIKKEPNISTNNDKNDTITEVKTKRPKIDIKMRDIDSIKYLNDKFKKTHDIIFALMLCENFYKRKDYQDSLKWSIIANDIDSSSERSWIWFAKSKYRLNQKDDAIKALRSFLRTSSSQKIKSLLRNIVNGEMND